MKLVVGLGNPGPRYETTRHNIGFLAVDRLIDEWKAKGPNKKDQAEVYQAEVGGEKVLLIKPQTFMNLSGKSVAPPYKFFQCAPSDLLVIHDELDLLPGRMRIKVGGGSGGHNGIKSIDECLGSGANAYVRMRLGIGHPRTLGLPHSPADFVLEQFTDGELSGLDTLFDRVVKAAALIVSGNTGKAMTQYNSEPKKEED